MTDDLKVDDLAAWAADTGTLRPEAEGEHIAVLQRVLTHLGWPLDETSEYDQRTEDTVSDFQYARMIVDDGVAGRKTKGEIMAALAAGWRLGDVFIHKGFPVLGGINGRLGRLQGRAGKMSTFGGPRDKGDRRYGQALFPGIDTMAELYAKCPWAVDMGLFTPGLEDPLPSLPDWKGRVVPSGISYGLDPDSFYCAMRWPSKRRPDPEVDRIVVGKGGRAACLAPTDFGPAKRLNRPIDMSPGAANHLGVKTDQRVWIAWGVPGAPLGPMTPA